jgi:potassium efflux system protein
MKKCILALSIVINLLCASHSTLAKANDELYAQQKQLLNTQLISLQQRVVLANQTIYDLQQQTTTAKLTQNYRHNLILLNKIKLAIHSTENTLASVTMELKSSQQAMVWLDKNIQDIQNQLHSLNIFGTKASNTSNKNLHLALKQQQELYQYEKTCGNYLSQLQQLTNITISSYNNYYTKLLNEVQKQKLSQNTADQLRQDIEFAKQQEFWLQKLTTLTKLKHQATTANAITTLDYQIFYANENMNLVHLSALVKRYHDQLWQIQGSLANTSSMGVLEFISDQAQNLGKQILLLDPLLTERSAIIAKNIAILSKESTLTLNTQEFYIIKTQLINLQKQFVQLQLKTKHLNDNLTALRLLLEKHIQQHLSARQGLPGFSASAWLDLGKEIIILPSLSYKLLKSLAGNIAYSLEQLTPSNWLLLIMLETAFISLLTIIYRLLATTACNRLTTANLFSKLQYFLTTFLRLNIWQLGIISNCYLLLVYLTANNQYIWLIKLFIVWLILHWISTITRTGLVETIHTNTGYDMKLYRSLKAIYICGLIVTTITIFLHQLPLIYEITDLFDRLFLLLLSIIVCVILYYRQVINELITFYLAAKRSYVKRIIDFMVILIPSLLLCNTLIGLFGFVNLVWIILWYESIFIIILLSYFLLRGILSELMEFFSQLIIQYIPSGWLLTQAILKPVHSIMSLTLFVGSWIILFVFYGWDQQSPVVERLNNLIQHPLIQMLNTTITTLSIIKLVIAGSIFYWAARWTRELIFRLLLWRIKDIGIRNSIAILSQYAVVISGILVCLQLLGIDLHELFLVASGLLIAIGFGIRDLVNNFACGFLLLFERPVRVGDIICIDDYEGTVTNVGSRAVTLRTPNNIEVIIPNTMLFNKIFSNWTANDDIIRTVITLPIDRRDNPFAVQKLIYDILSNNKNVLKTPEPEVLVANIVDSTYEFEVRYYVKLRNIASRLGVRSDILCNIWKAFHLNTIKIPRHSHEIIIK